MPKKIKLKQQQALSIEILRTIGDRVEIKTPGGTAWVKKADLILSGKLK